MAEQISRGGLRVDISPGELIDKITILELKLERINDQAKLANVRLEYDVLMDVYAREIVESDALSMPASWPWPARFTAPTMNGRP